MGIVAKLTLRHLGANRKRTVVTILGIIMSTALISAMLLGFFSLFKFFGFVSVQREGDVQAVFYEMDAEQVRALKADDRVLYAGVSDGDPLVSGVRVDGGREERYRVGNIIQADSDYFSEMIVSDYEGHLPADSSEIAVEEKFLEDNGLELSVGDKLPIEIGNRYYEEPDGSITYTGGDYNSRESFNAVSSEICTITAILHDNRPTDSYSVLRGMGQDEFPEQLYTEVRICLRNTDHTSLSQINQLIAEYGADRHDINMDYMVSVLAFDEADGAFKGLLEIIAIGLLIVMVTSVILIVNSLGMSLAERMRYLGMLASVGATAGQKRFSIYFEGAILGAIGIPAGIIAGIAGTKATLVLLGSRILQADFITGAENVKGGIPLSCSPWVILLIVALSGVTIFAATMVPAIKASRVMPVDALKQTDTVKVKAKKLKVSPVVRKIWGCEGELAYKNIKRNGLKGTVITVSIAVSVVMFLTINYFCDSIQRVNTYDLDLPYQLVAQCSQQDSGRLRDSLLKMDGVDDVFTGEVIIYTFDSSDENTDLANGDIADRRFISSEYEEMNLKSMSLVVVDDADFREILRKNDLDEKEYFGSVLKGVLLDDLFREDGSGGVFDPDIVGQSLHYDEVEDNPPSVEVGSLVKYDGDTRAYKLLPKDNAGLFVPESMYFTHAAVTLGEDFLTHEFCVVTDEPKEVREKIYELFENEGYENYSCMDLSNATEIMDTVTLTLKTAMYGFTTLLTLIAVANIVNTISTGVLLRRKEFAMYKSMGMEGSGFRKMIRLETVLYGLRALIFAIPASILLSYLMYSTLETKLMTFRPDWLMYILVVAAVFLVVGTGMLLSINTIRDDNIIEVLKEDAV